MRFQKYPDTCGRGLRGATKNFGLLEGGGPLKILSLIKVAMKTTKLI